ncbi:MAG: hypothetical protein B6D61_06575 [Bacteroidetes bacterium 4484_249]|nr:MAG: hypothetical protein B6D61_06575 [Bacteroidetes bacterium 4484_249]
MFVILFNIKFLDKYEITQINKSPEFCLLYLIFIGNEILLFCFPRFLCLFLQPKIFNSKGKIFENNVLWPNQTKNII